MYTSADKGATWVRSDSDFPDDTVNSFTTEGTTILASTKNNGIWKLIDAEQVNIQKPGYFTNKKISNEINVCVGRRSAQKLSLVVSVASAQKIECDLYSILGEKITTFPVYSLSNGSKLIDYDLHAIPHGWYCFKLQGENGRNSKNIPFIW